MGGKNQSKAKSETEKIETDVQSLRDGDIRGRGKRGRREMKRKEEKKRKR